MQRCAADSDFGAVEGQEATSPDSQTLEKYDVLITFWSLRVFIRQLSVSFRLLALPVV